jgi:hypothetical protein
MATSQFNAEKWTSCLVLLMGGRCSVPKGQNGSFVSDFRCRKLDSPAKANELLVEAAQLTTQFALSHLQKVTKIEIGYQSTTLQI